MADMGRLYSAARLDQLASLNSQERREVATIIGRLSDTFAEVPDGQKAGYVLGVLAHLIDPECLRICCTENGLELNRSVHHWCKGNRLLSPEDGIGSTVEVVE